MKKSLLFVGATLLMSIFAHGQEGNGNDDSLSEVASIKSCLQSVDSNASCRYSIENTKKHRISRYSCDVNYTVALSDGSLFPVKQTALVMEMQSSHTLNELAGVPIFGLVMVPAGLIQAAEYVQKKSKIPNKLEQTLKEIESMDKCSDYVSPGTLNYNKPN